MNAVADRLREFIRSCLSGGCRMLSKGAACWCPLCDVDRLVAELDAARADLRTYGQHTPECSRIGKPCSCGWSARLAEL